MKRKITWIFLWTLLVVVGYLTVGILFHYYLFPLEKPDYNSYFKQGDQFHSDWEGFDQVVLSQKDGWINTRLTIKPNAAGPPVHIHTNFDETFTVKEGILSVLINGEKKTFRVGEQFTAPKGMPHKPFNETDFPVIVENEDYGKSIPVEFAYHLSQIYRFVDDLDENPSDFAMLMQLSVYGDEMDAWLADAPPVGVQKAMRFMLAPTARLLGYKNYYEAYRIKEDNFKAR